MWQGLCSALIILLLMGNGSAESIDSSCKKREKSIASLTMAKEAISKGRTYYPDCTDLEKIWKKGCGPREKSFGFLDVAMNLIAYSLQNYPSCFDDNEKEKINKTVLYEKPMDCTQVLMNGHSGSGIYPIWLMTSNSTKRRVEVFCDMETAGGGWTVIQRRGNYLVQENFFRDWTTYKLGFGNLTKDFWIGNENLFDLTNQETYAIRFDLEDAGGFKGHALYRYFRIDNESSGYKLHINDYSGDVGDGMAYHDNMMFSTQDRKNDKTVYGTSCSIKSKGAWWYDNCYQSNLNGIYLKGSTDDYSTMNWNTWRKLACLGAVEMKLKKL